MNDRTLHLLQTCDEMLVSKLQLLSQLLTQLQYLTVNLEDENPQGLDLNFSVQEELMKQLDMLQAQYESMMNEIDASDKPEIEQALTLPDTILGPAWCSSLLFHLREQKKLLQEISDLNQQAKAKSLVVLDDAKEHLKTIKSKKDMISGYYQYSSLRTGRMLDTK